MSLGVPGAGLPAAAAVGAGGGEWSKARGAAHGTPRPLVCALGRLGVGARQLLSRVQHAAPDLGSGGGWGSRAGSEGVTAGRAAAVRGLRGRRPGARGWEDLQSGLGGVVVELSRFFLSCPPLRSIMGSSKGTPGWSLEAAVPAPAG